MSQRPTYLFLACAWQNYLRVLDQGKLCEARVTQILPRSIRVDLAPALPTWSSCPYIDSLKHIFHKPSLSATRLNESPIGIPSVMCFTYFRHKTNDFSIHIKMLIGSTSKIESLPLPSSTKYVRTFTNKQKKDTFTKGSKRWDFLYRYTQPDDMIIAHRMDKVTITRHCMYDILGWVLDMYLLN